jgi:hypothetical protein
MPAVDAVDAAARPGLLRDGKAFHSTSDLVPSLATKPSSVNGENRWQMVMSLMHARPGPVIAVTSNIAFAATSALAARIGEAFVSAGR